MPHMAKNYSNDKIGVDVGDQGLRDRRAFADHIKCYGWNRKWGMHATQQNKHQGGMCWADLHDLRIGDEDECMKYILGRRPSGSAGVKWAYNIGLIKGILGHIKRHKKSTPAEHGEEDFTDYHTIENRGRRYKDMRCQVCLWLKKQEKQHLCRNTRD